MGEERERRGSSYSTNTIRRAITVGNRVIRSNCFCIYCTGGWTDRDAGTAGLRLDMGLPEIPWFYAWCVCGIAHADGGTRATPGRAPLTHDPTHDDTTLHYKERRVYYDMLMHTRCPLGTRQYVSSRQYSCTVYPASTTQSSCTHACICLTRTWALDTT